jgi:trk system potassium uptake protein TrkA
MKKQFAVIGLGRFGSSLAKTLVKMNHEILAIDYRENVVQDMSSVVTHAIQADSTDEEAMKAIGIRNFDVVIVAIGENIQASILTTLILKELGVPQIVVKASNELHGKVLQKIGADKVIFPERDMGERTARNLISSNIVEHFEFSTDYSIAEVIVSTQMIGKNLRQLDLRAKYNCNIIAIKRGEDVMIPPSADEKLKSDDVLVIVGKNQELHRFESTLLE